MVSVQWELPEAGLLIGCCSTWGSVRNRGERRISHESRKRRRRRNAQPCVCDFVVDEGRERKKERERERERGRKRDYLAA